MFLSHVRVVMMAAAAVTTLGAGAVALAHAGGPLSPRSEDEQEHPKVVLTSPKTMDVTVTQPYVCRIHGRHHINVRAPGKGHLNEINVKEGHAVKRGDLMFKIAQATNAKPDAASANVIAPFDGMVGRLRQQRGSVVMEGDILTTLSDNSVIWAYFNVPEARYLEYMANRKQHEEDRIELVLANGVRFPQPGQIGAISAQFNNSTGSIPFRADFPNPDGLLRHGQTGKILIHQTLHDATVIPQRATYEKLDRRYVYIVDKDNLVHPREIDVQNETEDLFVIKKGVGVGDRIVFEGVRQVRDGEKVESTFRPPDEVLAQPHKAGVHR